MSRADEDMGYEPDALGGTPPRKLPWRRVFADRTILWIMFMGTVAMAAVMWHVSNVQDRLVRETALRQASTYNRAVREFRTLYASEVVDRLSGSGVTVTHDYRDRTHAIPLPATLSMMFGEGIAREDSGTRSLLYSPYPFPWREGTGGLSDAFARDAWKYLLANPESSFSRFEDYGGRLSLRFATADRMREACVECHIKHPASPKRDWKVGDVRGVLEIVHPLDEIAARTKAGLESTFLVLLAVALPGFFTVLLVHRRLRTENVALETSHSQLEAANDRLDQLANIDALTGLLNRRGLQRALPAEMKRAARYGWSVAALLVDCDDFKAINGKFGHAIGDNVLQQLALRLRAAARQSDHVARIGGDEFVILLSDTDEAGAQQTAERIRLSVSGRPFMHSPEPVGMTISIGVAIVSRETNTLEELLFLTRLGLERSKRVGKNRSSLSREEAPSDDVNTDAPRAFLHSLIAENRLLAVFQPLVRLADDSIAGFEVLVRAPAGEQHRNPGELFAIAGENSMLTALDLACFKVCASASVATRVDTLFHLNLLPSTLLELQTSDLLDLLGGGRTVCRFCIELSEQQALGSTDELAARLADLERKNVAVAIDDVGREKNTLDAVVALEPHVVKIDMSLVQGVATDPRMRRRLRRVVAVMQSLGIQMVAEGVERSEDLAVVRDLGIEFGQGYLWSEPREWAHFAVAPMGKIAAAAPKDETTPPRGTGMNDGQQRQDRAPR